MSDGETSFADFEAKVNAGEPAVTPEPAAEPEAQEPLDLTDGDEAVDTDKDDPEGEDNTDAEGRKRRSKPAHQRIAELTAKLREAERKLEAKDAPATPKVAEKPNPADYEFGEADPEYIDKLTDWKLDARDAERAKATEANQAQQELIGKVSAGVATAETTGKVKYADFEEKVSAAVEARGGDPLPPQITVAIAMSPVGADLIYHLATDEAASEKLETLAKGESLRPLAMAFGEIEGQYTDDDADLDISDDLDMARMLGRMRARIKGGAKKAAPAVAVTKAPEPPVRRARGGSGQFQVGADTTDFAAFERMANAKR